MKNVMLYLDEKDLEEIEKITDNVSEFVREAIKEKLGKKEKTLEEINKLIEEKTNELNELKKIKENLEKMEKEKKEKLEKMEKINIIEKQKEFEKIINFLINTEEIKELIKLKENNPNALTPYYLLELVEKIREKYNLRISVNHLKEILNKN